MIIVVLAPLTSTVRNNLVLVIQKSTCKLTQCRIDSPQLLAPAGSELQHPQQSLLDFRWVYIGQITVDYLIANFAQMTVCGHASKLERYANQLYFQ